MFYYNIFFLFILGLLFGSFLSVVVSRLDKKETVVYGRSKCPRCKRKIMARDLIPVLSFLMLGGKCRECKKKISIFYPFVELSLGVLFALTYYRFYEVFSGASLYVFLALHFFVIAVLLIIFTYDYVNYIIPDKILIPASFVVLVSVLVNLLFKSFGLDFLIYDVALANVILGVVIGGGFFLSLVLISGEKWMGWGDVKLGGFLGLVLGYPLVIVSIVLSFIIGSIYSLVLIWMKKKTSKDIIPFGPFLVIGAYITIFFGKFIIKWYLGV